MDDHPHPRDMAASPLGWLSGDSLAAGRRFRQRRAAAEERRFVHPQDPRPTQVRERWRLIVRGRVQGVGYRYSCQRQAEQLGLSGWVRNRPDGTVEVEAEGPVQLLGELQLWCARGPQGADVSGVTSHVIPCNGSDWFEIRR